MGAAPHLGGGMQPVAGEDSSSAVRGATLASAPPRRSRLLLGLGVVGALLAGAALTLALLLGGRDEAKPPRLTPSASAAPSPPPPRTLEELVNVLSTKCKAWGPILIGMRDSTDAFALEAQRTPGGWETRQAVVCLAPPRLARSAAQDREKKAA